MAKNQRLRRISLLYTIDRQFPKLDVPGSSPVSHAIFSGANRKVDALPSPATTASPLFLGRPNLSSTPGLQLPPPAGLQNCWPLWFSPLVIADLLLLNALHRSGIIGPTALSMPGLRRAIRRSTNSSINPSDGHHVLGMCATA